MVRFAFAFVFCAVISVLLPLCLCAQTNPEQLNQRVLVVYDALVPGSKSVALYYLSKRAIPRSNLCRIRVGGPELDSTASSISWSELDSVIKRPLRKCLNAVGRDKILYIVFSYGTPFRITSAPAGFGLAIDQYISDIWDQAGAAGLTRNPYYSAVQTRLGIYPQLVSLADYRKAANAKLIYSVWRLDAATPTMARGLVDKAIAAERDGVSGKACIDRRFGDIGGIQEENAYGAGDWALFRAAEFLQHAGVPVVQDTNEAEFGTPPAPPRCDGASFYAGWYSLNHYNDAFTWLPGAIGIHLDSASALDPRSGSNWVANAVLHGITVTSGAVSEPYLQGLPHVDGIVHDLLQGANVGDAFLRNTSGLRWMIINVGDPLYKPRFVGLQRTH